MFTMTGYIYALHLDGEPFRYVGMTSQPPEKRLAQHRRHLERTAHLPLNLWIVEVGPPNVRMTILEYVTEGIDVGSRERHWIAEFQRQGIVLLNRTLGGQRGAVGYKWSDEAKARKSAQMLGSHYALGYVPTPEHRAKLAAALNGRRCVEGCTCKRHSPEPDRGAKISAAKRKPRIPGSPSS
jgi:hypothetical protein